VPTYSPADSPFFRSFCLLLLFALLLPSRVFAQRTVTSFVILPEGEINGLELAPFSGVFLDPSGQMTYEEARTAEYHTRDDMNFGFLESAIWVRFRIQNKRVDSTALFLYAASSLAGDVCLYCQSQTGGIQTSCGGNNRSFHLRPVLHRAAVIPLNIPTDSILDCRLRVASELRTDLPLLLFSPKSFYTHVYNEQLLEGLYFGILVLAIFYNLFIFISIRDRSYFLYVVYVLFLGLLIGTQAGYSYQYLWPESSWWNQHCQTFLGSLVVAITCVFAAEFLDLRTVDARMRRMVLILALLEILGGVTAFWFPLRLAGLAVNSLSFFVSIFLALAGVRSLIAGYRPARFFLLAFAALFCATLVYLLSARGFLFSDLQAMYVLQAGSAFEVMILSLGLGDRINLIRARNETLEKEGTIRAAQLKLIESEMDIARRIQLSILPSPRELPGFQIATRFAPMHSVGGDFYDFYPISKDILGVLIADVSGHGIPAALIAAMLKIACAEQLAFASRPDLFLSAVNRAILGKQAQEFITAGFGVIDRERGTLQYANAGHPPLLVVSQGQIAHRLRPFGRPLGLFPDPSIAGTTIPLFEKDRLIFYTDGILEVSNSSGNQFGETRLEEHILHHRDSSPEELCESLFKLLRSFSGNVEFEDDITLIVVDLDSSRKG